MNYSLNLLGYDDSMILHYGGVNLGLACHHNSFSVSIGCVTMLRTVLHLPLQDEFKTAGALTLFVSVFCQRTWQWVQLSLKRVNQRLLETPITQKIVILSWCPNGFEIITPRAID